jgi:hypothetical protein
MRKGVKYVFCQKFKMRKSFWISVGHLFLKKDEMHDFFSQKCLPKLKMDIYKCPKMENRESNMEKPSFVTINEN